MKKIISSTLYILAFIVLLLAAGGSDFGAGVTESVKYIFLALVLALSGRALSYGKRNN